MAFNKDEDYWGAGQEGMPFDDVELQSREQEFPHRNAQLSCGRSAEFVQKSDDLESSQTNQQSFEYDISSVEEIFNDINLHNLPRTENLKLPSSAISVVAQITKNLILGLDYSFRNIKRLEEKVVLLKSVVESHDGNAILTVILFLRETLNKQIFLREVSKFIDAVEVYMIYLEDNSELTELEDMYLVLDKYHDAAVWKFENTVCSKFIDSKVKTIDMCLRTYFHVGIVGNFLHDSLSEFKDLVKDLSFSQDDTIHLIEKDHEDFLHFEATASTRGLIRTSVLYMLILSILYWCRAKKKEFPFIGSSSNAYIQRKYSLTKKQFQWCAVRVFASVKEWKNLDDVISSKSWLKTTVKNNINYTRIIDVLTKLNVPLEIKYLYIMQLQNPAQKLQYAKKYNCHSSVIEMYKTNKDRLGLENYSKNFEPDSIQYYAIQNILTNLRIKWRN